MLLAHVTQVSNQTYLRSMCASATWAGTTALKYPQLSGSQFAMNHPPTRHFYLNSLIQPILGDSHLTLQVVLLEYSYTWWRHQMETFSALLALCGGNSPVNGEFPPQKPVTRSFDVCFGLRLNKRLSKPSRRRWFEMPSRSFWRHCNDFSETTQIPWLPIPWRLK